MTALAQVATLDCARPCPICDRHLELIGIETVPWAPHTSGERLLFRCANCGVSRTEWNTLPIVAGPEIVPWRTERTERTDLGASLPAGARVYSLPEARAGPSPALNPGLGSFQL
jgi:hypothetical protein